MDRYLGQHWKIISIEVSMFPPAFGLGKHWNLETYYFSMLPSIPVHICIILYICSLSHWHTANVHSFRYWNEANVTLAVCQRGSLLAWPQCCSILNIEICSADIEQFYLRFFAFLGFLSDFVPWYALANKRFIYSFILVSKITTALTRSIIFLMNIYNKAT